MPANEVPPVEAVSTAVGAEVLGLVDVRREPIEYDAFLAGRTVVRVRGIAVTPGGRVAWSMIAKRTAGPGFASPYLHDNGLRELRAYASGLLDDLAPGLRAPRAYRLEQAADGELTVWLEDLGIGAAKASASDVVEIAGRLGALAGRWFGNVPPYDWLFAGWLNRHAQSEAVEPALERLRSLPGRKEVEDRVGWSIADAVDLIEAQPRLRSILANAPETLCHHDAVAANVFRRRCDVVETVLIDWESVGPGPIGADLASLLFSSARRGDIPAAIASSVRDDALAAYAEGMRVAGSPVHAAMLARGFHAAVALRWTLTRDVALALAGGTGMFRGSAPGESAEESLAQLIELSHVLFDSARRARPVA